MLMMLETVSRNDVFVSFDMLLFGPASGARVCVQVIQNRKRGGGGEKRGLLIRIDSSSKQRPPQISSSSSSSGERHTAEAVTHTRVGKNLGTVPLCPLSLMPTPTPRPLSSSSRQRNSSESWFCSPLPPPSPPPSLYVRTSGISLSSHPPLTAPENYYSLALLPCGLWLSAEEETPILQLDLGYDYTTVTHSFLPLLRTREASSCTTE